MRTTYYVALHTYLHLSQDCYTVEAMKLSNLLQSVLANKANLSSITKDAKLESCHCEAEILHDVVTGLTGKCVVDMESEVKVMLDKPKMSALLKAGGDWPNMKLEKRAIETD